MPNLTFGNNDSFLDDDLIFVVKDTTLNLYCPLDKLLKTFLGLWALAMSRLISGVTLDVCFLRRAMAKISTDPT